jgi:hypothetical protein
MGWRYGTALVRAIEAFVKMWRPHWRISCEAFSRRQLAPNCRLRHADLRQNICGRRHGRRAVVPARPGQRHCRHIGGPSTSKSATMLNQPGKRGLVHRPSSVMKSALSDTYWLHRGSAEDAATRRRYGGNVAINAGGSCYQERATRSRLPIAHPRLVQNAGTSPAAYLYMTGTQKGNLFAIQAQVLPEELHAMGAGVDDITGPPVLPKRAPSPVSTQGQPECEEPGTAGPSWQMFCHRLTTAAGPTELQQAVGESGTPFGHERYIPGPFSDGPPNGGTVWKCWLVSLTLSCKVFLREASSPGQAPHSHHAIISICR